MATVLEVEADGRVVRLTHPDKLLWPDDGVDKKALAAYFSHVAPALLPHLRGRPLTLVRHPDGIHAPGFFAKNPPPGAPPWLPTFPWQGTRYLLAEDKAALVYLASQAGVEIHAWSSTTSHPTRPDRMVLDLDPAPPAGWQEVVEVAEMARLLLERVQLFGLPKTSGGRGLHVLVPLRPEHEASDVVRAAKFLARVLADAAPPGMVTLARTVARRRGVYVDYLQNGRGRTMIAPYSPRARPGAPVSAPVRWDELRTVKPEDFTVRTMPARLENVGDLLAPLLDETRGQTLAPLLRLVQHRTGAGAT